MKFSSLAICSSLLAVTATAGISSPGTITIPVAPTIGSKWLHSKTSNRNDNSIKENNVRDQIRTSTLSRLILRGGATSGS